MINHFITEHLQSQQNIKRPVDEKNPCDAGWHIIVHWGLKFQNYLMAW